MTQPGKNPANGDKSGRNPYRTAFDQATQLDSAAATLQRCAEVEAAVESLRVRYEQFFLGLTRAPPNEDHILVRSAVLRLRSGFVRNTSARFRVQSLHNRFLTFERLWQRTCREIEDGTYRRDLFKARLRRKVPAENADDQRAAASIAALGAGSAASDSMQNDSPVEEHLPSAGEMAARPPPARAAAAPEKPGSSPALADEKLRALYEAYVGAKRRCRESTDGLSFDSLASSLRRQVPTLLEQHKATAIDFKVVIKGGKAVLKAIPR